MAFKKAERKQVKIKIALTGPSGGGKTYSALLMAKTLADGGKIAVLDTENESASLYAGSPGIPDFDTDTLAPPFLTARYMQKIREAESSGYSVLIIDSISHQWNGEGGIMDRIDKEKIANPKTNSFTIWSKYTPEHEQFKQAILQSPMHIICTMRAKTAYVITENDRGKQVPKRAGMESIQRDGIDYEFGVVFEMEPEKHFVTVNKDRTGLFDGQNFVVTEETGKKILDWIKTGKLDWKFKDEDLAQIKKLAEAIRWDGTRVLKECQALHQGRSLKQLTELEFTKFCHSIAVIGVEEAQKDLEKSAAAVVAKVDEASKAVEEIRLPGTIQVSPEFEAACAEMNDMMVK